MVKKIKKVSLFWKVFFGVIIITLGSNLILAFIIFQGYETIISQIKPLLSEEAFQDVVVNVSNAWIIVGSTIIFILLLAILFAILFTANILKPLRNLLEAVSEVKKGNLNVRVEAEIRDEIGELASQFNSMILELKSARELLEEEKEVLEIRVKARTQELEELAQNLEKRVKERTKELEERIEELEKFHRLTVGRELKMVEMKKEIEKLQRELEERK